MDAILIEKDNLSKNIISNLLSEIENVELKNIYDELDIEKILEENELKEINLILFDINSSNSKNVLQRIELLKRTYKNLDFIALSSEINSSLVTKVLSCGVDDFLLKPVIKLILEASITKLFNKKNKYENFSKVISIFSNKGGVGKTSLVTNFSYEISNLIKEENQNVCILDLNSNTKDVNEFLNIEEKLSQKFLLDNLDSISKKNVLDIFPNYKLNSKNSNLYTYTFPQEVRKDIDNVLKVLNLLKEIFSYIIIDNTVGLSDLNLTILNKSDLIYLVCLENQNSIKNIQKCLEILRELKFSENKIKLILNRHSSNFELSKEEIIEKLSKNISFCLPNNYLVLIDAINQAKMVSQTNPQSNIAKAYKKIAKETLEIDFLKLSEENKLKKDEFLSLIRRIGD